MKIYEISDKFDREIVIKNPTNDIIELLNSENILPSNYNGHDDIRLNQHWNENYYTTHIIENIDIEEGEDCEYNEISFTRFLKIIIGSNILPEWAWINYNNYEIEDKDEIIHRFLVK